ncbi:MAG: UDP-N-acetylmuramoyl-tripeptide--D-alanyl-D-alanine ligase [Phycisphaerae bacterium]|nr:UDP-N-acetylmuramoyl-tripeptide--D-alanyl-D-alanine ligase [Phycisphaerae bacterium]
MLNLALSDLLAIVAGATDSPRVDVPIRGVNTDSRRVVPGELFVAIRGERFDGHDFMADAAARGASAVLAETGRGTSPAGGPPLVRVRDTVAALGALAASHRRTLRGKVIAVAGSNGKTTTKLMIHHLLSGRWRGTAAPGSFNNQIGVPLTLLAASSDDDYVVVEIGTNARGEVAALAAITSPDAGVITSIGEEHLEGLGDRAGVAAEECALLPAIRRDGRAFVNLDSAEVEPHLHAAPAALLTLGRSARASLRLAAARVEPPWTCAETSDGLRFRLPMCGVHNADNALAALAVARWLGVRDDEIVTRLAGVALPGMRNQVVQVGGVTIINDAYNANPPSVVAALDFLEAMPTAGRRWAVLGEMRELGPASAEQHRRVAADARRRGIGGFVLVGAAAALMGPDLPPDGATRRVARCGDAEECACLLARELHPGDVVLLKASRAVQLERVLEPLGRLLRGSG